MGVENRNEKCRIRPTLDAGKGRSSGRTIDSLLRVPLCVLLLFGCWAPVTQEESHSKKFRAHSDKELIRWIKVLERRGALEGIWSLSLARSRITDRSMGAITKLRNLADLEIRETDVEGHSFRLLSRLQRLEAIDADESQVDGIGIRALADNGGPPRLKRLFLRCCPIGDRDIQYLAAIKSLEYLNVYGTQVTKAGVESLRKKRPELRIDFGKDDSISKGCPGYERFWQEKERQEDLRRAKSGPPRRWFEDDIPWRLLAGEISREHEKKITNHRDGRSE